MEEQQIDYEQFDKERIISISDLIEEILRKIWLIIILAVVFAVVFAGYKYSQDKSAAEVIADSVTTAELKDQLSADQMQKVNNVFALCTKLQQQQEYVENSPLMQINPYNEDRITMQFAIQTETGNSLDILNAIQSYINQKGIAEDLKKEYPDIDNNYVSELVSFECDNDALRELPDSNYVLTQANIFSVQVLQIDETSCQKLADAVLDCLAAYQVQTNERLGSYQLELLNESYLKAVDSELQSYQYSKVDSLISMQDRVTNQMAALSDTQNQVLSGMLSNEEIIEIDSVNKESAIAQESITVSISKKYLGIGILAGIILGIILIVLRYVTRGTLNLSVEFQNMFNIRTFGQVNLLQRSNILIRMWRKITNKKNPLSLEEETQLTIANVKNYCKRNQVNRILFTGSGESLSTNAWMKDVLTALRQQQIEAEVANDLLYSSETLEIMTDYDYVVLVETLHVSRYGDVKQEIQKIMEQNVHIAGAIVLN